MSVRIGLIGLKGHFSVCTEDMGEGRDWKLVAVAEDDAEKLASVSEWSCVDAETRTYSNYQQMLDEVELDVVCEAGVDSTRGGVICACAERGIHVLAEKPLAFTLEELAAVQDAVHAGGIALSMMMTMRYEPAYVAMKEAVAGGAIGEVCQASMQKSYRLGQRAAWQKSSQTFSGIIPFIGIHALDLIWYTSGRHFVWGSGYAGNTGHPEIGEMEDNACLALRLDNGGSAAVRLDYCRPAAAPTHGDDRLRLAGSKGVIEAGGCGEIVTLMGQDEAPRELELPAPLSQWENFISSIYGDEECLVPAADCFYLAELVLRLREAVKDGTVAQLPAPEV